IYNLLGQKVRTLLDKEQQPGRYEIQWNGRNDAGSPVASGIYLYRMQANAFVRTRRLTVLK
ncbi:MAG: FlgD immunoglobulin-like domain containing protein, partial [Rhodothermales bacterium]